MPGVAEAVGPHSVAFGEVLDCFSDCCDGADEIATDVEGKQSRGGIPPVVVMNAAVMCSGRFVVLPLSRSWDG